MSYKKQNFKNFQVLHASHLNYIEEGILNNENIFYQITDPDNYPLNTEEKEEDLVIALEIGGLSRDDGSLKDNSEEPRLRTPNFIPIPEDFKINPVFDDNTLGSFCFLFYDSNYNFITGWNDGYNYRWTSSGISFYAPENASYFKGYCAPETNITEGVITFLAPEAQQLTRAEHKKIYIADHGYSIYGDIIDDETMHKMVVYAEGLDDNSYNIIEVKAPSENPLESTICLMNWGNGNKQFVDISSMTYEPDDPTVEIVCQTRGGMPLPEFSVRYNDGQGAGRVKKLTVSPDAIPVYLTSEGFKVRRNNDYNNNMNDEEYVTVNLAELYDTVNSLTGNSNESKVQYIEEEARRVSNLAHEKRTANSFVFAALSDLHYNLNDNTNKSIKNTAKALYEIDKNISLDTVALLGDFVKGDSSDTVDSCNDMLVEVRRTFYDILKDTGSIWVSGNHDNAHYYTKEDSSDRATGDDMYSYLGSNNKDTVIDSNNRQRIYGYKDFETQKIRVIYLNTADLTDNTSTSSCYVGQEQLNWLTSTGLNFSNKSDATEWGIIFFSHHPLEWSSTNTKPIITIIDNYIAGTGDFASITNRAEVIAAFHGHTHNFHTNAITEKKIPSIGIPQVCYGRYNEYAEDPDKQEKFGEFLADGITPVYYQKNIDSAEETSFNIIIIDRDSEKIHCVNYGAGRDREYNFTGDIPAFEPTFVTPIIENGSIDMSTGLNEDNQSIIRTVDYIDCEEKQTYMFVTNDYYWCLLFYDENKTLITNWREGKSYKYLADASFKAPKGAKYMRLFCEDTSDINTQLTIHNIS